MRTLENLTDDELEMFHAFAYVWSEKEDLDLKPFLKSERPRAKRKSLRTPAQVLREISTVVSEIASGEVTPQAGRARLYGLQTLLVAMRMKNEMQEPEGCSSIRRLEATADTSPEIDAGLRQLQQHT